MKTIATATTRSTPVAYRQDISTGAHHLVADEPINAGGQDAGPAPYDLLLASLGACTAITLRMYADRKGWDLGTLRVELALLKNAAGETRIERVLHSSSALSDEQWSRILDIASKTPVTKTIQSGTPIVTQRGVDG
jgi:putative redox protein